MPAPIRGVEEAIHLKRVLLPISSRQAHGT